MQFSRYFRSALLLIIMGWTGILTGDAPVSDSFTADLYSVLPGGTVNLTLQAHDPDCSGTCTTGCGEYIREDMTIWSADGGSFLSENNSPSGSPYTATAVWEAPMTEATYTITVDFADSGTFMCGGTAWGSDSLTITVSLTANNPPVIDDLSAVDNQILVQGSTTVTCTAHDPDSDPITYGWSADIGTISGSGSSVTYTGPSTPGMATITCTVTDDESAFSQDTVMISVSGVIPERSFSSGIFTPQRLSTDSTGLVYVADRKAGGVLAVDLDAHLVTASLSEPRINGLDIDWNDKILVGTELGARVLDTDGSLIHALDPGNNSLQATDVAADPITQSYAVLYSSSGVISIYDSAGIYQFSFGSIGDAAGEFKNPSSIEVTPAGDYLVGDKDHGMIQVFDPSGAYQFSFATRGGAYGEFNQLEDLAVDSDGNIYVTDSYQSRVQVFNPDGSLREIFGQWGVGVGELMTPTGITVDPVLGRVVVASYNAKKLEIYNLGGGIDPETNTIPTVPVLLSPVNTSSFILGNPVILEVENSTDPDEQILQYEIELYDMTSGSPELLTKWMKPEGIPTTTVDATSDITEVGEYLWHARSYDGLGYSGWSSNWSFTVTLTPPNQVPSIPTQQSPIGSSEVSDLVPFLTAVNATDLDGDPLTYFFEVALYSGITLQTVAVSPEITEGGSGTTGWQVPGGILELSQEVFWRCRAYDGKDYSIWSAYESFKTAPFPVPTPDEVGNLPAGDPTRPYESRYRIGPASDDTTIYFQLYDVTAEGEVELEINGYYPHTIPAQITGDWSFTALVTIPAGELNPASDNDLRFIHSGSDDWGIRQVTLIAPPVPDITAVPYNTVIDLHWTPDTNLPSGTTIRIYRSTVSFGPFTSLGDYEPGLTILRDTGLINDTTYYYHAVYVSTESTESEPSLQISATPTAALPTPVVDLRVRKAVNGLDVVLYWSPVTTDPVLDSYEIYKDTYGFWNEDTSGFTNLETTIGPLSEEYTDLNGLINADTWYSVITLDTIGQRGAP